MLIRGSGVDTSRFIHLPESAGIPTIVLASRMLWDKGVGEFVDAAKQLRKDGVNCRVYFSRRSRSGKSGIYTGRDSLQLAF